jgi:hypothetical protein
LLVDRGREIEQGQRAFTRQVAKSRHRFEVCLDLGQGRSGDREKVEMLAQIVSRMAIRDVGGN